VKSSCCRIRIVIAAAALHLASFAPGVAVGMLAALAAGCATVPQSGLDSGISGAAPGADPMIERARGR
jgi:hypothetical protein